MSFTLLIDRIQYYFTLLTSCFTKYNNYSSLNSDDTVEYSFLPSEPSTNLFNV